MNRGDNASTFPDEPSKRLAGVALGLSQCADKCAQLLDNDLNA